MQNEIGPADDMFVVYRGRISNPLDPLPAGRYIKKDCWGSTPLVPAGQQFRKAIAEAEKSKVFNKP